jgi:hypothetical protein
MTFWVFFDGRKTPNMQQLFILDKSSTQQKAAMRETKSDSKDSISISHDVQVHAEDTMLPANRFDDAPEGPDKLLA